MSTIDLAPFANLVALDHGLSVVVTLRADHSPHATVVNAGVLPHPLNGSDVVGFVTAGDSRKLINLRTDPSVVIVVRAGWQWTAAEGSAQLMGPDDPDLVVDGERLRLLLRDIFTAAGGTHDDWDTYDRVMAEERRVAVFIRPDRIYGRTP